MNKLFNAVRVALGGKPLSESAMKAIEIDLSIYPRDKVITALGRCLVEIRGNLYFCDVIDRIDGASTYDGLPYYKDKDFVEFVMSGKRAN